MSPHFEGKVTISLSHNLTISPSPLPFFTTKLTSGQRLRLENVQQQRHNNHNPNNKIHRSQQISNPLSPLLRCKTSSHLLSRHHRQNMVHR